MYKLWDQLQAARSYHWVELSHSLNNESPYWAGIPSGSVELSKTVFDWGNPMLECLIQTFKFPGQFGTHIDFPGHFIQGGALSEQYGVQDIKAWEAANGPIPDGAFVALRTDWSKRWPDMNALSGIDAEGGENFPGWSLEALQYLYEVRNAAANGHETLDTDASAVAAANGDLACERYVLRQNKIQVEVLCNLDKVPAAGAVLFVAFPRI